MDAKINGFTVYILKSNRFHHTSAILNRLNLNINNDDDDDDDDV